jgi:hypothetical protein
MKKTVLAVAMGAIAASGSAFAQEHVQPVETKVYGGAEIGGNFGFDDQYKDADGKDATFEHGHTITVGGEIAKQFHPAVKGFVAAEADFTFGTTDEDVFKDSDAEVDIFVFGAETKAGVTTFGIQNGIADDYDAFGDLSMEHGLNSDAFAVAISDHDAGFGQETLQHRLTTEKFDAGVSYDMDTEAYVFAGSVNLPKGIVVGGAYVDAGEVADMQSYTLGAQMAVKQFEVAAKYDAVEGKEAAESTAYALSGAYALNEKVKVAGSYNSIDFDDAAFEDDDYFTLGASYQVNNHVELVTDYKFASEADDKLFVRANINF